MTECPLWAGLSVEFVKDLPPAGELVQRLWREIEGLATRVSDPENSINWIRTEKLCLASTERTRPSL